MLLNTSRKYCFIFVRDTHSSARFVLRNAAWSLQDLKLLPDDSSKPILNLDQIGQLATLSGIDLKSISISPVKIADDINIILRCAQTLQASKSRMDCGRPDGQVMVMKDLRDDSATERNLQSQIFQNSSKSFNGYFVVPKVWAANLRRNNNSPERRTYALMRFIKKHDEVLRKKGTKNSKEGGGK
eukprot:gene5988-12070_t